ncbi:methyltransferase domain-containing protein [Pontibacillus yanchengensis]|uniref:Methyltransferase domain-containing protein n=2 Tax=Pontibacillus yanchengensis TaxID=462910 RepID=A0ACC7VH19_9BACI|nr:class I SAM-dependent methyltransferase [Pontibacillus yanchengensis]MYL34007.1 methyltransferase domain-containing protein [Pontibacillus yanchengensis]MYL54057.1 methyltransferase domain-containing protein [Pontibacillus yanchengensis]
MKKPLFDHLQQDSYALREAAPEWRETMEQLVSWSGQQVVDLGCGGGIYTKALSHMNVEHVHGIDASETMLQGAREYVGDVSNVTFLQGETAAIPLGNERVDTVVERAVIHHLQRAQLQENLQELYRVLKPGGQVIIQDRTLDDCFLPPDKEHLRGHIFSMFPRLKKMEKVRRHSSNQVIRSLHQAGFHKIKIKSLLETRQKYPSRDKVYEDIMNRTGRTILHELNDDELRQLATTIYHQYKAHESIQEQDRWTIWIAEKPIDL